MAIEVEENERLEGKCVAVALIGPHGILFEIYVPERGYNAAYNRYIPTYFVDGIEVPAEVYRDCLATAEKDRYCPNCCSAPEGYDDVQEAS